MPNPNIDNESYPFATPGENSMRHRFEPQLKNNFNNLTEDGTSRKYNRDNFQNMQRQQCRVSTKTKNKPFKKKNSSTKHTRNRDEGQCKIESISVRHINNTSRLRWESDRHVSIESERALLPILLHYGERERGMMKDHPEYRIQTIQRSCSRNSIQLMQALSLRRHHVQQLNQFKTKVDLGLGSKKEIYDTAMKFEEVVENYLMFHSDVTFLTEIDQKKKHNKSKVPIKMPPTPDFLFPSPVIVHDRLTRSVPIHWIEAKMFYGASTIPRDDKSAVGRILTTAEKYVHLYGPGAIVFAYGCGTILAEELRRRHVLVLGVTPLDLTIMKEEQRKWCADSKGRILI